MYFAGQRYIWFGRPHGIVLTQLQNTLQPLSSFAPTPKSPSSFGGHARSLPLLHSLIATTKRPTLRIHASPTSFVVPAVGNSILPPLPSRRQIYRERSMTSAFFFFVFFTLLLKGAIRNFGQDFFLFIWGFFGFHSLTENASEKLIYISENNAFAIK
jgi:hypothetical protein